MSTLWRLRARMDRALSRLGTETKEHDMEPHGPQDGDVRSLSPARLRTLLRHIEAGRGGIERLRGAAYCEG